MTFDAVNNRVVVVTDKPRVTNRNFSISIVAINSSGYFSTATLQFMFDLPAIPFDATLKHFAVDGWTNTYIFACERIRNEVVKTVIQGVGEDGAISFRILLGPDMSNLGLFMRRKIADHQGLKLKLSKSAAGNVADLRPLISEIAHGAFTGLGLDEANSRLYMVLLSEMPFMS